MSVRKSLSWLTGSRLIISTGYRFVYPFLPVIARGLGVSLQQAGLLVSARSLSGTTAPILVALSRRTRRRRVIGASVVLFAFGSALAAATGVYAGALIGFVLMGISKPAFDVAAQAYLADRVPYRSRARYLASMELAWAGGMLAGAPAVGLIIEHLGWRAPFWTLAGLGLLSLTGVLWALEPDSDPSSEAAPGRLRLPARSVALMGVVALLGFAGDNLLVVLGAWLEAGFGLAPVALGGIVTLIAVAELAGEGGTIAFTDRLGKARSVAIGLAVSAAGFGALLLAESSLITGVGALLVALGGFEFAYVSSIPLASEAVPEQRTRYLALYMVSFFVGRTIGAAAGPALFAAGGIAANAAVTAGCQIAALILIVAVVGED